MLYEVITDDFSSKPGVPNMFGLVGAEANSIAPEFGTMADMDELIKQADARGIKIVRNNFV